MSTVRGRRCVGLDSTAATSLNDGVDPTLVRNDSRRLADFQRVLTTDFGVALAWPGDIRRHRVRPEGIGR